MRRLGIAIFLATFFALLVSTLSMIGVVSLGTSHYEELIHQENGKGVLEFELMKEKEDHQKEEAAKGEVNLRRFISILLPLGFFGWILEGVITSLIIRYIHRLRPDLLRLGGGPS